MKAKEYYESNIEDFTTEETRLIDVLSFTDDLNNRELIEKIKGLSFKGDAFNRLRLRLTDQQNFQADNLKDNIDYLQKKARLSALQSLLTEHQAKYNKSFLDKDMEILFEKKGRHQDQYVGRTIYNQSTFINTKQNILNKILNVKITNSTKFALECQI